MNKNINPQYLYHYFYQQLLSEEYIEHSSKPFDVDVLIQNILNSLDYCHSQY